MPKADISRLISAREEEMRDAAGELRFEYASRLRDEIAEPKKELKGLVEIGVGVK